MPIFLDKEEYGPWLQCGLLDAPLFFKQHPGPFLGAAAPLARAPKVAKEPNAKDELLPPKPVKASPPPPPAGATCSRRQRNGSPGSADQSARRARATRASVARQASRSWRRSHAATSDGVP